MTRVMNRTVRQIAEDRYEIALELASDTAGPGSLDPPAPGYDTSIRAFLGDPSGPYPLPAGPLYWGHNSDTHSLPWTSTLGPFDFTSSGRSWPPFHGIEITADGVLQLVSFVASAIGVALGANEPYTVTWDLMLNNDVLESESVVVNVEGASNLWGGGPTVIARDVAVSTGDILSGRLSCLPVAMEMFRCPMGINAGQNGLVITGGAFP